MINQEVIRAWYTPVEVVTLRSWLVVATIVTCLLLTFDFLSMETPTMIFIFFYTSLFYLVSSGLEQIKYTKTVKAI